MSERVVYQAVKSLQKTPEKTAVDIRGSPHTRRHIREVNPAFQGGVGKLMPPGMGGFGLKPPDFNNAKREEAQQLIGIRGELAEIINNEKTLDPDVVSRAVLLHVVEPLLPFYGTVGPLGSMVMGEVAMSAIEEPKIDFKKTAKEIVITALLHAGLHAAVFLSMI